MPPSAIAALFPTMFAQTGGRGKKKPQPPPPQRRDLPTGEVRQRLGEIGSIPGAPRPPRPASQRLRAGQTVHASDRDNWGRILTVNPDGSALVKFVSQDGAVAEVNLPGWMLTPRSEMMMVEGEAVRSEERPLQLRSGKFTWIDVPEGDEPASRGGGRATAAHTAAGMARLEKMGISDDPVARSSGELARQAVLRAFLDRTLFFTSDEQARLGRRQSEIVPVDVPPDAPPSSSVGPLAVDPYQSEMPAFVRIGGELVRPTDPGLARAPIKVVRRLEVPFGFTGSEPVGERVVSGRPTIPLKAMEEALTFWETYVESQFPILTKEHPSFSNRWASALLDRIDAIARGDTIPVDEFASDPLMDAWVSDAQAAQDAMVREGTAEMVSARRGAGDQGEEFGLYRGGYRFEHSIREMMRAGSEKQPLKDDYEWQKLRAENVWRMVELASIADLRVEAETAALASGRVADELMRISGVPTAAQMGMVLDELGPAAPQKLRHAVMEAIGDPDGFKKIAESVSDFVNTEDAKLMLERLRSPQDIYMSAMEAIERVGQEVASIREVSPGEEALVRVKRRTKDGGESQDLYYITSRDVSIITQGEGAGGYSKRIYLEKSFHDWQSQIANDPLVTEITWVSKEQGVHQRVWPLMATAARLEQDVPLRKSEPPSMFSPARLPPIRFERDQRKVLGESMYGMLYPFVPRQSVPLTGVVSARGARRGPLGRTPEEVARLTELTQQSLMQLSPSELREVFRVGEKPRSPQEQSMNWKRAVQIMSGGEKQARMSAQEASQIVSFIAGFAKDKSDFWDLTRQDTAMEYGVEPAKMIELRRNTLFEVAPKRLSEQADLEDPGVAEQRELMELGR